MRRLILCLAAAAAALTVTVPASAKEATLRAGFFIPAAKEPFKDAFMAWIDMINKEGKGLVQVNQVVGPEAVPGGQWCNFIRAGTIQLVGVPPAYCSNLVPGIEALDVAEIPPAEQREKGVYEYIRELTRTRAGSHFLAQYGYGVNYHMYTGRKIEKLEDFKGLRFRTNPAFTPFYNALGINGIQMANGEIYAAMERGVIEGYAIPPTLIVPFGLHRVTKYRIDTGFYNPVVIILVNQATWDGLNGEQQAFLERMGVHLEGEVQRGLDKRIVEAFGEMEKGGVETIKLDPAVAKEFVEKANEAMWETVKGKAPETAPRLRELLSK